MVYEKLCCFFVVRVDNNSFFILLLISILLLYKSPPYTGGTNSCLLNEPLRWWYISTLEVQPYAGGTVAIGKPEQQVRKVSHCGSKQQ